MSISNTQPVDALNSNAAWVSKTVNSDIIGIPSLKNNGVGSGAHVINPQKAINKSFDTVGITDENDATAKVYANNNFIADGDNHKTAIEKLDAQLVVAGAGAGISAESFVEVKLLNSGGGFMFSIFELLYDSVYSIGGTADISTLKEQTI
jgi:hypothetical protein